MKAIEFVGKTNEIKIVQVPKPTLPSTASASQPNVLVKVVAAAIDQGFGKVFPKVELPGGFFVHSSASPLYLGWHFSGIVEQTVGDNCDLAVGTAVFGFLEYAPTQRQGSFAEYILVKSKECAVKPESISHELAAAASTEAVTALQALRDVGKLTSGKSVLICGASGGVGSAAVCIAKLLGASKVTAMCSDREVDRVRNEFQPDAILNRTKCQGDPIKSCGEKFDLIFDCPSAFASYKYFSCLKPKGSFVDTTPSLGFLLGVLFSLFSSKRVGMVICKSVREDLNLIGEWLAQDKLKIPIDSTFPVGDMRAAIVKQEDKSKKGRVVIKIQDGWGSESADEPKKQK